MTDSRQQRDPDSGARPKWFNSPVTCHKGTLDSIRSHIPAFERRCFSLGQPGNERSRLNERLDTIVRLPIGEDPTFIPVGVVSKGYVLVPHSDVLDVAKKALDDAGIAPSGVAAELEITEYGERMALSLFLPEEYSFDPGDGYPMALRLECFNSIDGSTRFRALMGWFRLVCSNGLVIGVTRSDVHRRHVGDLRLEDVGAVLANGMKESVAEKKNFEGWYKTRVSIDHLSPWVDKDLRKAWGFKAAARAFHIARTGLDAEVAGQYKGNAPSRVAMRRTTAVPGAPVKCRNLFDLSQILAWLAKERRDLQEQMEWRDKIPDLMARLMN